MEMQDIMKKARALMDAHDLKHWGLEASRGKRIAGVCWPTLKKISLSKEILPLWPDEEVLDTILHEIAHALTPKDAGHGSEWKSMCRKVGARPDRLYAGELTKLVPKKWTMTCDCGNAEKFQVHRRSKGNICVKCRSDIGYFLTGEDKSTAEVFGDRPDYKIAVFANEHHIEYKNGAWWAPEGTVFVSTETSYLDTSWGAYYDDVKGKTDWKSLWEDMRSGLTERI